MLIDGFLILRSSLLTIKNLWWRWRSASGGRWRLMCFHCASFQTWRGLSVAPGQTKERLVYIITPSRSFMLGCSLLSARKSSENKRGRRGSRAGRNQRLEMSEEGQTDAAEAHGDKRTPPQRSPAARLLWHRGMASCRGRWDIRTKFNHTSLHQEGGGTGVGWTGENPEGGHRRQGEDEQEEEVVLQLKAEPQTVFCRCLEFRTSICSIWTQRRRTTSGDVPLGTNAKQLHWSVFIFWLLASSCARCEHSWTWRWDFFEVLFNVWTQKIPDKLFKLLNHCWVRLKSGDESTGTSSWRWTKLRNVWAEKILENEVTFISILSLIYPRNLIRNMKH